MTPPDYPLQVFVFNVGQGDHLLIQLPNGSYGIIDTHYDLKTNPHNEPPGLTFLKKQKAAGEKIRLRFFHLSHFHQDHLKGLKQWIDWIQINDIQLDYLLLPGTSDSKGFIDMVLESLSDAQFMTSFWANRMDLYHKMETFRKNYSTSSLHALDGFKKCLNKAVLSNKKRKKEKKEDETEIIYLNAINRIYLFHDYDDIPPPLSIYCIAPLPNFIQDFGSDKEETISSIFGEKGQIKDDTNQNDISTVLLLRYGYQALTFGGDAEIKSLVASIDHIEKHKTLKKNIGGGFKSHFIKVFHHGGSQSSTPKIWKAFLAENSQVHLAISAGINKKYNHPHKKTIDDAKKVASEINSSINIYATNRDYLTSQDRVDIPLTTVTESRKLFNPPSNHKRKEGEQRLSKIDPLLMNDSDKTKARNQHISTENRFLGYCFEFEKSSKEVKVVELTMG
jgi:Predicted hydrolase (metallo-beta-lactamase superfamily)